MRKQIIVVLAGLGLLVTPSLADITDINSMVIQEYRFADFPSTLVSVDNYPSVVSFTESNFVDDGAPNFANQHVARFSTDDTNPRTLLNSEAFDIKFDIMIDIGSVSPRKEAGFRMDTMIAGEQFFIATSDGEVAAFGGALPFHTFGGDAYTPGTVATMRMIYRPGATAAPGEATMEYMFDPDAAGPMPYMTSGELVMGNTEDGIIDGTDIGIYVQNQPNTSNPGDFSIASFENFMVAVPEPASLMLLGLGGWAVLRRRR